MAGDLEDFLRRAAERRRAKADVPRQPEQRPPRRRPEYTDSRRERMTQPVEVAELVDDEPTVIDAGLREALARPEQSNRRTRSGSQTRSTPTAKPMASPNANAAGKPSALDPDDLIAMLTSVGGLQQAIVLKEILERPEHRW